jgi:RNA polymerase sigma factor (sigma-70 family)
MKFKSLIQRRHSSYKGINWFALFTEGNRKAFSHCFELQYPGLFYYARRVLGDAEAARKIVLCAFADAWKNREGFANPDQLKSFIRETVRENCTTYRLSLVRENGTISEADRSAFFDQLGMKGPHMERIHKEILAEMFQKLELLPEDSKWVLHHAIAGRKSRSQLAEEWRISENAAAIRKSRAFKTLLSLLGDAGPTWY